MGSACRVPHVNRDGSRASGLGSGGHCRGFFSKILQHPGDGCWEWQGYLDKDGYGKLCTLIDGRRRTIRPHRWLWEQTTGLKLGDRILMHTCDNRRCVRPDHLRPGTQTENMADMDTKGRRGTPPDNRGELSPRAILTEDAVREIRAYRGVYGAIPLLAKLHGTSREAICGVMYGKSWRHVVGRAHDPLPIRLLRELVSQREAA